MQMKNYYLITYLFLVVISGVISCSRPRYAYDIKEYHYDEKEKTLIGEPTGLEYEGDVDQSLLIDTLLLVAVEEPEGLLNVYTMPDFSFKTTLCRIGRARNEFSKPFFLLSQHYKRGSDTYITTVDKDSYVKEINLTESIEKGNTVVSDVDDCPSVYGNNKFLYLNDDIHQMFVYSNKVERGAKKSEYLVIDRKNDRRKKINVFPKTMATDEESMKDYSFGSIYKHPQKNLFVQLCQYIDYILFFDLDENTGFAVHREGAETFDDIAPDGRKIVFACGCLATEDYLFAIRVTENEKGEEENSLLIFNWSGELIAGAKLVPSVNTVMYDEKQNILYGWDAFIPGIKPSRRLIKFDLNDFIK